MPREIKIFLSSSMRELPEERAAVLKVLEEQDLLSFAFERHAGSREGSPKDVWEPELLKSHVCLVMLWHKVGVYTRDEIDLARAHDRPLLIYHRTTDPPADVVEDAERKEREEGEEVVLAGPYLADASDPNTGWTSPQPFEDLATLEQRVREDLQRLFDSSFLREVAQRNDSSAAMAGGGYGADETAAGLRNDETPRPKVQRIPVDDLDLVEEHIGPFVGRLQEMATFREIIGEDKVVRVIGSTDIGRKALVQSVVHEGLEGPFADGCGIRPDQDAGDAADVDDEVDPDEPSTRVVDDLVQAVWEAFYEPEDEDAGPVWPSKRELKRIKAFVVLYDVRLGDTDLERLTAALPKCRFGVTMPHGIPTDERAVVLGGIDDPEDQLALFGARSKAADLDGEIRRRVLVLCDREERSPGRIRKLGNRAYTALKGGQSLDEWLTAEEQPTA